ncbi:transmembrane protein 254 isoform X2 [Pseudophryne corroboree]|uniref:transmembrane protein 254 isoform X2 n=1 Tax=Pseudophryne corroboree TaxID=495146 RepID=UPI0030819400
MASAGSASYFQRANLFWMAVIVIFLSFFTWTVFWPTQVPYEQLGPLGSLAEYLVKNYYNVMYRGYWVTWVIHISEASYGLYLCRYPFGFYWTSGRDRRGM